MLSSELSKKHRQLLQAVNTTPTKANIRFSDLEKLVVALGGRIVEGDGSRISFHFDDRKIFLHRPHPGKEAKKYQVEGLREFFEGIVE